VEDRLGRVPVLLFYLLCGALWRVFEDAESGKPASG
jgi:hypothetical protein